MGTGWLVYSDAKFDPNESLVLPLKKQEESLSHSAFTIDQPKKPSLLEYLKTIVSFLPHTYNNGCSALFTCTYSHELPKLDQRPPSITAVSCNARTVAFYRGGFRESSHRVRYAFVACFVWPTSVTLVEETRARLLYVRLMFSFVHGTLSMSFPCASYIYICVYRLCSYVTYSIATFLRRYLYMFSWATSVMQRNKTQLLVFTWSTLGMVVVEFAGLFDFSGVVLFLVSEVKVLPSNAKSSSAESKVSDSWSDFSRIVFRSWYIFIQKTCACSGRYFSLVIFNKKFTCEVVPIHKKNPQYACVNFSATPISVPGLWRRTKSFGSYVTSRRNLLW